MIKNNKHSSNSNNSNTQSKGQIQKQQELNCQFNLSTIQSQSTSKKKFQRKTSHSPMDLEKIKTKNKSFKENHRNVLNIKQHQCLNAQNQKLAIHKSNQSEIVQTLQTAIVSNSLFIKQSQILKRMQTNTVSTNKEISTCQTLKDQPIKENKQNDILESCKSISDIIVSSIQHLNFRNIQQEHLLINDKLQKKQQKNKISKTIKLEKQNKNISDNIDKMRKQVEELKNAKTEAQKKYNKLFQEHKKALDYIKKLTKQRIPKQFRELQSFRQMSLQTQLYELKNEFQSSKQQRQKYLQFQLINCKHLINQLESDIKSLRINNNILQRKAFKAQLHYRASKQSISFQSQQQQVNSKIHQQNKALKKKNAFLQKYLNQIKRMMTKKIKKNNLINNDSNELLNIHKGDMEYSDEDTISFLLQLEYSQPKK